MSTACPPCLWLHTFHSDQEETEWIAAPMAILPFVKEARIWRDFAYNHRVLPESLYILMPLASFNYIMIQSFWRKHSAGFTSTTAADSRAPRFALYSRSRVCWTCRSQCDSKCFLQLYSATRVVSLCASAFG